MLDALARRYVRTGSLSITDPKGRVRRYGDGAGAPVHIRLHGRWTVPRLMLNAPLALGEAYMDGRLTMERGDIHDLLDLVGRNLAGGTVRGRRGALSRACMALVRWRSQRNGRDVARRNVAHHYDISNALYRRFLDPAMQYSCAYFTRPDMTLEEAQAAKMAHLAAKLGLGPGDRLLDIGCGWGGLALALAQSAPGIEVLGVTLSVQQLEAAQAAARQAADPGSRVRFALQDYRDVQGRFDRIVSVGMFEHVGRPNFQAYFDAIARRLTPDGVAVVHSIGRMQAPGLTNPFIAKYIFPGGYIPSLSEVLPAIERAGLWVTDLEVLRLHYAETLRCWRERFVAQWDKIAAEYDERFCRMFAFYFAVSEAAFRHGGFMVFQLQLARRQDAVPLTRDYIGEAAAAGPARPPAVGVAA